MEIKSQASILIDDKLASFRKSLSEAAAEQKRVSMRNAAVAVGSAIVVALVSITSKKMSNSPFDALTVFRIVLGMFAAGGAASLLYRLFLRYKTKSELERDAIKVIISEVRMLNPKGFAFQAAVLLVALTTWLILALKPELLGF